MSAFIHHSQDAGGAESYDTEMLSLTAAGGGLPSDIQIRESPTRAGTGGTTIRAVPGGFMVSSFFDIYIEVSTDGLKLGGGFGACPCRTALRSGAGGGGADADAIVPPPVDKYVSPADYHIALASGIIIRDIKHKLFTQSVNPPPVGGRPATHHFDSQLDFQLSTDGGQTWQPPARPPGVDVQISRLSSGEEELYETEMLGLTVVADLPGLS